jgi:hypothetical protein
MLTVVIKHDGEDKVVALTYENLWRELKDIPEAELVVNSNWLDAISNVKNKYVCFVEADCLVSSGYFSSQISLFQKNKYFRKLAMLSSAVGVNNWGNRFYGYTTDTRWSNTPKVKLKETIIIPSRDKKSSSIYPIQFGYVPGSVVRVGMLRQVLQKHNLKDVWSDDLEKLSIKLSTAFWMTGDGNRVHINPNTTYVTTVDNVNDISYLPEKAKPLLDKFAKESI